jgi:hypothetical protein
MAVRVWGRSPEQGQGVVGSYCRSYLSYFMHYNFARVSQDAAGYSCEEAGVTTWELDEIARLANCHTRRWIVCHRHHDGDNDPEDAAVKSRTSWNGRGKKNLMLHRLHDRAICLGRLGSAGSATTPMGRALPSGATVGVPDWMRDRDPQRSAHPDSGLFRLRPYAIASIFRFRSRSAKVGPVARHRYGPSMCATQRGRGCEGRRSCGAL